jgi:hypothetical protein
MPSGRTGISFGISVATGMASTHRGVPYIPSPATSSETLLCLANTLCACRRSAISLSSDRTARRAIRLPLEAIYGKARALQTGLITIRCGWVFYLRGGIPNGPSALFSHFHRAVRCCPNVVVDRTRGFRCALGQLLLGDGARLHLKVHACNGQLQRRQYQDLQLRNLHRRRGHGYLLERLREAMHDDTRGYILFGLLQRPM